MKKKIVLVSFLLSLPFWWGVNNLEKALEEFFFWQTLGENPGIFTAQVSLDERLRELKPIKKADAIEPELGAKAVLSVFLGEGKERVLLEKNAQPSLPLASLTKLMTAFVVMENYDLSKRITVSQEAVKQEESFGGLTAGQEFSVEYLLYPMLIESSNDAAFALAADYDGMSHSKFVELMNWEAEKMGLNNTKFFNVTGLDPEESGTRLNYSSGQDLILLTKKLLSHPLIWQILATEKYTLLGPELTNTNELLGGMPGIIGGKTGYTEEALGCMLLVVKAPKNQGEIINVILGSPSRFLDMEKLVNWVEVAYNW